MTDFKPRCHDSQPLIFGRMLLHAVEMGRMHRRLSNSTPCALQLWQGPACGQATLTCGSMSWYTSLCTSRHDSISLTGSLQSPAQMLPALYLQVMFTRGSQHMAEIHAADGKDVAATGAAHEHVQP